MSLSVENDQIVNSYQFFKANWLKEVENIRIANPEKQNLWSQATSLNITDELKANSEALEELRLAYKPFAQKGFYIDEFQNMGLSAEHLEKNLFIHYYGKNASGKNQFALVSKYDFTPIFKRHESATTLFQELLQHKNLLLVICLQFYNKEIIDDNDFTFKIKKYKEIALKDIEGEEFTIKNNELTTFNYSGKSFPFLGFTSEINPNSPLAYFYTKAILVDIGNSMRIDNGGTSDKAKVYFKGEQAPINFQTPNNIPTDRLALQLYPNTDYYFNERMIFIKIIVSNQPIEIYDDAAEINFTKNWIVFNFPIKIVQENDRKPTNLVSKTVTTGSAKQQKSVLWVYDLYYDLRDKGNESIIKKLIENNHTVDHANDSETAFRNLEKTKYDLIISDMGRGKDQEAGLKFLIEYKRLNYMTSFIIYTTKNNYIKYEKQALENGATAIKTGTWQKMSQYFLDFLHTQKNQSIIKPFKFKWILIAGTGNEKFSEKERLMCISLGKYLAINGYGIKCGGWAGVDEEISKSFSECLKLNKIDPFERQVQVFDYRYGNSFKMPGNSIAVTGNDNWNEIALRNVDAFIMVGGQGGTFELYEQTLDKLLPIIPIPATGGDALKAFQIISKNSLNYNSSLISNLNLDFENEKEADIISEEIINILNNLPTSSKIDKKGFEEIVENLYKSVPIKEIDDLQKYRWGRISHKDDKTLTVLVENGKIPGYFNVSFSIKDFYGKNSFAAFFLHDTFNEEVKYVQFENGIAEYNLKMVYEAFTVGAYLSDGTSLELDLNDLPNLPNGFYHDDISEVFKAEVQKIYNSKEIEIEDDLQKGRWGGEHISNNKAINAKVKKSLIPKLFNIEVEIISINDKPISGDVAFFIHDTFVNEIIFKKARNGIVRLNIANSYEAFTVGAFLQDGTMLELDLQQVSGFPKEFYYKK